MRCITTLTGFTSAQLIQDAYITWWLDRHSCLSARTRMSGPPSFTRYFSEDPCDLAPVGFS